MDTAKKYTLRLYDLPLADFILHKSGRRQYIDEDEIHYHDWRNMPERSDPLFEWVEKRTTPKYRKNAQAFFTSTGFAENDVMAVLDVSMALSPTDAYWITPEGFTGRFSDYSFYANDFPEEPAKAAFSGEVYNCAPLSRPSPEFASWSSDHPRCWRRISGELWQYKTAVENDSSSEIEILNEYYASRIAEAMGIEHTGYELITYLDRLAVRCRNYTDADHSAVSLWKVIKSNDLIPVAEFMEEHGFLSRFADMVLLDAVLLKDHRDYGGIEVLKNNHSLAYERLAPAFGNGECLYSTTPDDKLGKFSESLRHYKSYIGGRSHDEMVSLFCSKAHIPKLEKLYYYRIEKHPLCTLSETRLRFVEQLVQKRARELTAIILEHAPYKDLFPYDRNTLKETFTGDYKGYTYYYDGDPLHGGLAVISGKDTKVRFRITGNEQRSCDPLTRIRRHIDANLRK